MPTVRESEPMAPTSRLLRAWREGGLRLVVSRGAHAALAPWAAFGFVEFFVRNLGDVDADRPRPDGVVVEEASADAAGLLLMGREQPDVVAREIRRRFKRGDRCIVARNSDGRYLHSRWISTHPTLVPELDRCIVPGAGQVYMYDGYTRTEARGRGVDSAVRAYIFGTARGAGFREVVSYVRATNTVGLNAATKWQASTGRAHYLRVRRARPWVLADHQLRRRITLIGTATAAELEAERRARTVALKEWFSSWLAEPMDKRSTGFSALPAEYFASAGAHIVSTLEVSERDKVLDVGCSSGGISRHVAPAARKFVGVDMTAGLITDIEPDSIRTATGAAAEFAVADGRALPFPHGSFDKVFCTGVIHMLPTHDDALQMICELVRVCQPGGTVLVGAIPDAAKRRQEYRLLWRRANPAGKARLAAALLVPRSVKRIVRRVLQQARNEVVFLKFDLELMQEYFSEQGLLAEVVDYPDDYWSEDFRTTRSCLRLRVPASA
ncbi:MAG: class I SAM-dependent methyltransferase [Xanthomonadaceae bacterium]|nr:class I SAM-dependent methyltransferase [Xanthomonadaceae bacterium]